MGDETTLPRVTVTDATQRLEQHISITDLKTLIRYLPATYRRGTGIVAEKPFAADADTQGETWRYGRVVVHQSDPHTYFVGDLYVLDGIDGRALLHCDHFEGFALLTQRNRLKDYKSWDALVRDMKTIFGENSTIEFVY